MRSEALSSRPPRSIAWLLLLASAVAISATGIVATALILSDRTVASTSLRHPGFWVAMVAASALTLISLGLRALRWIFLLRRCETRIPIRDAYIGYLAGFSLMLAPFLLGEMAVRAYIHRQRGGVLYATTMAVNIWERVLDAAALSGLAAVVTLAVTPTRSSAWLLAAVAATFFSPARRGLLSLVRLAVEPVARVLGDQKGARLTRLASGRVWTAALATSLIAWVLPGVAFWSLAGVEEHGYGFAQGLREYAWATLAGGFALAPGGILVTGRHLLGSLRDAQIPDGTAALVVLGTRVATAGLSTALGVVFVLAHLRNRPAAASHFDDIADAYDVQIPWARREALLTRKTALMRDVLQASGMGVSGLDVGCGQGWYVGRMRTLGFDVVGIDSSPGQVQLAARNLAVPGLVRQGSVLHIPFPDESYDFVYSINVLHHLESVTDQRAAFAEIKRVLRPGGLVFLHEINTRNVLFRFYMGYVFPSLNCIDEGVERWILPQRLERYTDMPVLETRSFTFLPEFLPEAIVRQLAFAERRLEASSLRRYAAHYMAVLRRPV